MLQENSGGQLNKIREIIHEQKEKFNREWSHKKEPSQNSEGNEMNDWIFFLLIPIEGIKSRMNEAEERIYDIEHKNFEII